MTQASLKLPRFSIRCRAIQYRWPADRICAPHGCPCAAVIVIPNTHFMAASVIADDLLAKLPVLIRATSASPVVSLWHNANADLADCPV